VVTYGLCLSVVVVICAVAAAEAQNLSVQARQAVRVARVSDSASRSGGFSGIKFSDPYAPPVGTGKAAAIVRFPARPSGLLPVPWTGG
jgi:hypothetical protein